MGSKRGRLRHGPSELPHGTRICPAEHQQLPRAFEICPRTPSSAPRPFKPHGPHICPADPLLCPIGRHFCLRTPRFAPKLPKGPPLAPPPPPDFPTPLRRIFRDPQNAFVFLKRPRRHRRHFRRHRRYFRGHLNSILALGSAPWPLPSTAPRPNLPRAVTALPRAGRGSLRPPDLPQTHRSDAEPNRKHCPTSAPAAVHCGAPRPHWPPPTAAKGRGGTSGSTPTNQKSGCRAPPVSGQ